MEPFPFHRAQDILKIPGLHGKKIFLVAGKNSLPQFMANRDLGMAIDKLNVEIFSDYSSNPKKEEGEKGARLFREGQFDIILAIGGGSAIDTAKLIKYFSHSDVPLIVIPTTCGTGSEATTFATFYEGQKKRSADHPDLLPNHVFLDPLLLKTLPQTIKGHTLSDSFCHAIESYWNIHSTQISRQWASQAIHLIVENYFLFMKGHGKDEEALKASHLAGKAINLTKTTAAHALSYSMTSLYGIPHGQAAAISLPEFFVFHSKIKEETCQDERGVLFVRERMKELKTLLKVKTSEQAKKTLINIFKTFGLKTHLKELGIFDISPLMDYGLHPDRLKNNPRKITRADLDGLLRKIL